MKICVTGASGKAGQATVLHLSSQGHTVRATDIAGPPSGLGTEFLRADLTDHGQAVEVLHGMDAVVHLANIPAPDLYPPAVTINRSYAVRVEREFVHAHADFGQFVRRHAKARRGAVHLDHQSGGAAVHVGLEVVGRWQVVRCLRA